MERMDTTRSPIRYLPFPRMLVIGLVLGLPGAGLASDTTPESLRIADQSLNAVYQDVRSRLPAQQRQELLQTQRNWLGYRDTVCARESAQLDAVDAGTTSPMTRCLERLTRARTAELQGYGESLAAARTPPPPMPPAVAETPAPPTVSARGPVIGNCELGELPAKFTVQAVGIYEGDLDTEVRLEQSGHETRGAEVVVNRPGEDVVLVLMAYDPVLWTVKRTSDTRLAAVIVSGYHAQAVLGVERTLPLLITTTRGPRKDCGRHFYAYKAGPELLRADAQVQAMTGRPIDRLWSNYSGGRIHVGPPAPAGVRLVSFDDYRPEDYTDLAPFPSGQKGLDRLVEMGKLRRATRADVDAWIEAASAPYRRFDPALKVDGPYDIGRTYVVLGPMEMPGGLYGAHSAAFLIPAGVPLPSGHAGHSTLYLIQDGSCRGPSCPQHR